MELLLDFVQDLKSLRENVTNVFTVAFTAYIATLKENTAPDVYEKLIAAALAAKIIEKAMFILRSANGTPDCRGIPAERSTLYSPHKLLAVAYSITGNQIDALDVASTSLVKVKKKLFKKLEEKLK